jgi:endonuclease/exonuclease/phosphatase family metal-dependent hydrolase
VTVGERSITAVSVYGIFEDGYANPTMHRLLSDLTPLFDSRRQRLLLGGDLNISTQLEPPWDRHSRNVFDRLEIFGLVGLLKLTADRREPLSDCPCRDEPCTHVRTQRHSRSAKPWHNDYLFATPDLAGALEDSYALNRDEDGAWLISDHCPVVAEFSLPD